jgi:hypothetical protein
MFISPATKPLTNCGMGWVDLLSGLVREGLSSNHRSLIVLVGTNDEKLAKYAADALSTFSSLIKDAHGLYMYQPEYSDAQRRMGKFREFIGNTSVALIIGRIRTRISCSASLSILPCSI